MCGERKRARTRHYRGSTHRHALMRQGGDAAVLSGAVKPEQTRNRGEEFSAVANFMRIDAAHQKPAHHKTRRSNEGARNCHAAGHAMADEYSGRRNFNHANANLRTPAG